MYSCSRRSCSLRLGRVPVLKGIAHFIGGIAVASAFPPAVEAAAAGNPVYLLLGGACGLMPDTMDFKISRYFCRYDIEIAPDPLAPCAAVIANALKDSILSAVLRNKSVCVKLHTVRLSANRWQQYKISVSRSGRKLAVDFGNVIDSGGNIVERQELREKSVVKLPCDLVMDYGYEVDVGFLEGPTILFCPRGDAVEGVFIHWHRSWSHSLLVAMVVGLVCWSLLDGLAGIIGCFAVLQHVFVDQAGHMGGNLFFPFHNRRLAGARIALSNDSFLNFTAVWSFSAIMIWNIGLSEVTDYGILHFLFWSCAMPVSIIAILLRSKRAPY